MSKIGNLMLDIQELIAEGLSDIEIAERLNVPINWVEVEREEYSEVL